jgi:hypothetical protein
MEEFWTEKQKQDIAYFNETLEKWVADPLYNNKFVIISGRKLEGFFDTFDAALGNAVIRFADGEYIIQQIVPTDKIINFLSPAFALV